MKKKLFSLALALALCLGLTVPAFAAELKIVQVPALTVEEYEGKAEYGIGYFNEGLAQLRVYGKDGTKAGYIDKTGKVVIPAEYGTTGEFSEGLAAVEKDGKFGFIDKTEKAVIPFQYSWAAYSSSMFRPLGEFHEGLATVLKDGKFGYINKTGKEVVPPEVHTENGAEYILLYTSNSNFHDGIARLTRFHVGGGGDNSSVCFAVTVDAKAADWAREQEDLAAAKGLMPDGLGDDFTVNITRAEFAALSVKLYEAMSGEEAPAPGGSPFSDTDDPVVIQANALGIVDGKGDGKFAPDDLVTRQEAALMLSRVYTRLGGGIPKVEATTFADNNKVASWAMDAVAFMSDNKIVNGKGDNKFDPLGSASIQEAMVIALRMLENLDVK